MLAAMHSIVARTAAAMMKKVAGRGTPDDASNHRAVCEAFLAVWRLAPILNGALYLLTLPVRPAHRFFEWGISADL